MSTRTKTKANKSKVDFPVVGIGASAGGLDAFKNLLENLPIDTGLSFVVIQHLAAGQESMLGDILSRFTKIPVQVVQNQTPVEPNHVYVIPPGTTMTMENRVLKLIPKDKTLKPIDTFLVSLAEDLKTNSIGVILSGTGSDGTIGLKAIKAQGGITFAQTPQSAQYPDMPLSAISAQATDFVLTPEEIAQELQKIAKNPQLVQTEIEAKAGAREVIPNKMTPLNAIFAMLKKQFNVDFSHYKETVVNRRISRRMVINHCENMADYVEFMRAHADELEPLYSDMLIGVTNFFREPETFTALKELVFPELSKRHSPNEPIRIWVPGCSTGEEAYSFAIAIQEYLEQNNLAFPVQVFGTDVNEKNIEKARQGIYLKTIESEIEGNRLKHFFVSTNGHYQISKNIRDLCVFAKQDITADPPFSNMDLISCRNMLIYFDEYLHGKVVPTLHYALKMGGFLVLGQSESIGKFTNLFEQLTKKAPIYSKKRAQPSITFGLQASYPQQKPQEVKEEKTDSLSILKDELDKLLVTEYVPAALLVNANSEVLVFRGNIAPYILPESGIASLNVAKMTRKELRSEVQTMIYRAKKEDEPIRENAVQFEFGGEKKTVNIQVVPLHIAQFKEPFFLLLFEDVSSAAALLHKTMELTSTPAGQESARTLQMKELRDELESTKLSLQRTIETQEATNEELRTTMEEAQSSNEELQSTNEELETSKEELQSSNEELKTLNDEVKNRNQVLAQLNDDLDNLNRNVDPAVVIVDKGLKIRLLSPSAEKILNLSPATIGLPITSIRLNVGVEDNLGEMISGVISKLSGVNKEVKDQTDHFYEMRIRPYVTQEDKIGGAVLSFVDIDDRKKLEKAQKMAAIGETAGMVGHDIRNPLQAITSDIFLVKAELASTPESSEKRNISESLQQIEENVDYINKIVADLQDYAKTINPAPKEMNLDALCIELVSEKRVPQNIKATCLVDNSVKTVRIDPTLLKRVLGNLVSNAVQAMPSGGELSVKAYRKGDELTLTIRDTGVGISEKVKPKLFNPLFTTKSKGQGLGLAVVKRITEALGGDVTFESQEGKGTTFIVRLPLPPKS